MNADLVPNADSGNSSMQQRGNSGSAIITLRYALSCDVNFYGKACDVHCDPHDDTAIGHYVCDPSGNKVCLSGYQNTTANCVARELCESPRLHYNFYYILHAVAWFQPSVLRVAAPLEGTVTFLTSAGIPARSYLPRNRKFFMTLHACDPVRLLYRCKSGWSGNTCSQCVTPAVCGKH